MKTPIAVIVLFLSSTAGAQLTAPAKSLVEEMRIDGAKEDLVPILGIGVSRDGYLGFTQAQDNQLRIYDPKGALVARVGRKGAGPGEFEGMSNVVGWSGDRFWAYDFRHARVSVFARDGKLASELALPQVTMDGTATSPPTRGHPDPKGLLPDGSWLASVTANQTPKDPITGLQGSPTYALALLSPAGTTKRVVASPPVRAGSLQITRSSGMWGAAVPFVALPIETYARDGSRIAFVTTDANGGTFTIRVLTPTGDTLLSRKYPFTGRPIPRGVYDSAVAEYGAPRNGRSIHPPDVIDEVKRGLSGKSPRVYPIVRSFSLGVDGTMWIRFVPAPDASTTPWIMLDEKGNPIASITMPTGETFVAGSRSQVWTTSYDTGDLPIIKRYAIR